MCFVFSCTLYFLYKPILQFFPFAQLLAVGRQRTVLSRPLASAIGHDADAKLTIKSVWPNKRFVNSVYLPKRQENYNY